MPVPKRKTPRSKTRQRRSANLRTTAPTYASCPQCRQPIRPHHVCANCGNYGGRQAVETE